MCAFLRLPQHHFFSMLLFILSCEADVRESLSNTNCLMDEICFKEIVSNTRLDQFYIIHY